MKTVTNNIPAFLLILLIIGSPALADVPNRPSQWAVPIQLSGVPNLHKIADNLYRSAQPTRQGMKNLKLLGIKTVINLRPFYYDTDEIRGTELLNEELSVKPWHIEDEDVIRVLRIIRKKENGPFLIHCKYGADRTGVMSAMYRIVEQGWSQDDATEEEEAFFYFRFTKTKSPPSWPELRMTLYSGVCSVLPATCSPM